jgi:hypothetical protein
MFFTVTGSETIFSYHLGLYHTKSSCASIELVVFPWFCNIAGLFDMYRSVHRSIGALIDPQMMSVSLQHVFLESCQRAWIIEFKTSLSTIVAVPLLEAVTEPICRLRDQRPPDASSPFQRSDTTLTVIRVAHLPPRPPFMFHPASANSFLKRGDPPIVVARIPSLNLPKISRIIPKATPSSNEFASNDAVVM